MKKDTLWIISELYPPEETSTGYIMGEIAKAMTQKYNVKVICGPKIYDKAKIQTDKTCTIDDTIEVIRVDGVNEDKNSKFSRIKKFVLMSLRLYQMAKKCIKNGDKILMVTNPFPLIILMGHLRRHRQFKLNMLVHDIAPENLFTEISIPTIIYHLAESVFNRAYASTDRLISIGRDMSEILYKKCRSYKNNPEIIVIENWGDTENIYPKSTSDTDSIRIQYAGNIGNAQGIGEFVDVLYMTKCKNLSFNIWGTGSAEEAIKKKVSEYEMTDIVSFNGSYSRSQQQDVLNSCDIALVRLVDGMYGLGVPSKTYNILAAGKPILYIGEHGTEIWRMIKENGNGVCFTPNDKSGLVAFLKSLSKDSKTDFKRMGVISRKLAEDKYSKQAILSKYIKVL